MAKLFIFGIGGTGSRVIKSLTMLLAAGLKTKNEFEIVPIIIDPHKDNEDLKRTVYILDQYQAITAKAGINNGFFGTQISTLSSLDPDKKLGGAYTFNLKAVNNAKFKEYFSYNSLGEENKALADLLFSGKSVSTSNAEIDLLDLPMDIGFVGNPNVGSVVLNQFEESDEFKNFATYFADGDRIFIISSIFGGTGAAGFPTVLKNIRDAPKAGVANAGFLQNSRIGALTVMPYFNIDSDEKSAIKRSDFIEKTKAALDYYQKNVNDSVNVMYYLGDDYNGKPYPNDPGIDGQKNKAHFVELAGALAILDFINIHKEELVTENGRVRGPIAKEYGVKNNNESLIFNDLGDASNLELSRPLTQFTLFKRYLDEHFDQAIDKKVWSTDDPPIDHSFRDDIFFHSNLKSFLSQYGEWLNEMQHNSRGFAPFNLHSHLHKLVSGKDAAKGLLGFGKVSFDSFDTELAKDVKKTSYTSKEQKLLALFFNATKGIVAEKYFKQ